MAGKNVGKTGLFYLNKERQEYGDCLPYDIRKDRKMIICGVPGAFTPGCTNHHLPGFAKGLDLLKPYGIKKVIFFAVNDAMVMDAWNNIHGHPDIAAVSDPLAVFSKSIGEDVDFGESFGIRCNRCAYLIEDGELIHKFKDPFFDGVLEELTNGITK
jgi:2-Cys peroxiredoxin 5